mgnify:CR=1 FL=1
MKKKGFTLIELLAVIVVLAIIALIATPIVLNIIESGKKNAFIQSANGIISASEYYYSNKILNGEVIEDNVIINIPNDLEKLDYSGESPDSGSIAINKEGKVAIAVTNEKYCVTRDYDEVEFKINENIKECYNPGIPYTELVLNGADPVLKEGFIPITIELDGTVRKANTSAPWYSYEDKRWANVVLVTDDTRENYGSMDSGEIINAADILAYFVWIPRYSYKLWNVNTTDENAVGQHSIDIVFENNKSDKSNGTCSGTYDIETNGCYLTHPAFTFGSEELNGFWVGKFETSHTTITESLGCTNENCANADGLRIIPNVSPLRYNNAANMFFASRSMTREENPFGLLEDTTDTHMMKNIEWGATAYLSNSKYGVCSDGICKEIEPNLSPNADLNFMTGYHGVATIYGNPVDGKYPQSTTSNINGIFDMSGGAREYVMGKIVGVDHLQSGFGNNLPQDSKYIDLYESTGETDYSSRILGDATGELGPFNNCGSSWYNSSSKMPNGSIRPWITRGSDAIDDSNRNTNVKNIFVFGTFTGSGAYYFSFRVVLV